MKPKLDQINALNENIQEASNSFSSIKNVGTWLDEREQDESFEQLLETLL